MELKDEERLTPFINRLKDLYARMDRSYQEVADRYGFHCQGCEESCCRTTFYHHTWVEYLYLKAGVQELSREVREDLLLSAQKVSAQTGTGLFCPLNQDGKCMLYAYRPMICRLHGIAHELRRPDGSVHYGPGCAAFEAAAGETAYIPFDRSGFYWELSRLEREVRAALGNYDRIKMTVSQMVETMLNKEPSTGSFHR